jgi:HEAT repeat protein
MAFPKEKSLARPSRGFRKQDSFRPPARRTVSLESQKRARRESRSRPMSPKKSKAPQKKNKPPKASEKIEKIAAPKVAEEIEAEETEEASPLPPPPAERIGPPRRDAEDAADEELPAALRADEKAFSVQLLQFFLFPLLLVITCLAIFFVFGIAGQSDANIGDLLLDIREGGTHARRVAAHQLAQILVNDYQKAQRQGKPSELASDPRLADTLLEVLKDSNTRDADFKKFLFIAGSLTGDARFAPLAIQALKDYYASPERAQHQADAQTHIINDPEVEIYMALERLADPSVLDDLKKFYAGGDDDTRKLVVHAVGSMRTPEAEAFLGEALKDDSVNVRWNAALRLAARKRPEAKPVILKLLDPKYVESAPNIRPKQQVDWLATAAAAAATMGDPDFRQPLEALGKHPIPAVANAARQALERLNSPGEETK